MYSPRFPAGLCILLAQAGLAQYDPSPLLTPDDLSGARVATTGRYDGQALYGYIDGGAEVYLEYGFTRLTLQTVDLNGTTVNVELYRMKDSAAAFGIFSISRFRCRPVDSLGRYSCPSAYQVQIARGKYFLRASNATGTPDAQLQTTRVAAATARKIHDSDAAPPALFNDALLRPDIHDLYCFNGRIGLQNGIPEWIELFDSVVSFQMYALPVERNSSHLILAQIRFGARDERERFAERVSSTKDGPDRMTVRRGERDLLLLQFSGPRSAIEPYIALLNR
jgi:hypothetical protein